MKSKLFFLLLSFLIFIACGESPKVEEKPVTEQSVENLEQREPIKDKELPKADVPEIEELQQVNLEDIYGHYVGVFDAVEYDENKKPSYSNKINITIEKIDGTKVLGYSVVAGNKRPFEGQLTQEQGQINFKVKEPGDNRYDGEFDFNWIPKKDRIAGFWNANDEKLAVTKREYDLEKRKFEYNPNATLNEDFLMTELYNGDNEFSEEDISDMYESLTQDIITYNASTTLLKKEEVENMYQADLEVLRNAIYARHGYSFKNRRMRYLFDSYVDWYIPMKTNILADLTDLEKQNIDLLKRYEQHAEKYYDVFGR